jgi:hypothetical protein
MVWLLGLDSSYHLVLSFRARELRLPNLVSFGPTDEASNPIRRSGRKKGDVPVDANVSLPVFVMPHQNW